MLNPIKTINCQGRLFLLDQPKVMGILNLTPDSFYDGGRFDEVSAALRQTERMLEEGADIIDIGGMSSRPGAEMIGAEAELQRITPSILAIRERFPEAFISVDTVYSKTVRAVLPMGVDMINDISAGSVDEAMFSTIAELQVPYILMHMQGKPKDMQSAPSYEDIVQEILDFFIEKVGELRNLGCKDLIIDPGFGFGKSIEHNYQILKKMHVFSILDLPLLAGLSRKSMIYKLLNISPEEALNGTAALHMVALQQGSKLLRVHDVKAAVEVIKLWQQMEIQ